MYYRNKGAGRQVPLPGGRAPLSMSLNACWLFSTAMYCLCMHR